jgi:hypothetical protein
MTDHVMRATFADVVVAVVRRRLDVSRQAFGDLGRAWRAAGVKR